MNKILVILFLIAGYIAGFSQAPGYMGKRFAAGYGAYVSPGWAGSEGLTPVNLSHELFIELATSKKFSVGLSAKYYNAAKPNSQDVYEGASPYYNYTVSDRKPGGVTRLRGLNYALYGKFFKKKFLAPWGRYFILGVTLNTFTASYDPDQVYLVYKNQNSSYNRYFTDFGPIKQQFMKVDMVIGNGRSRVIADKIVLDYGYNINIWSLTSNVANTLQDKWDHVRAEEYIGKIATGRAKGVNGFNIFLKVGYLF